jgi:hypothetical protein
MAMRKSGKGKKGEKGKKEQKGQKGQKGERRPGYGQWDGTWPPPKAQRISLEAAVALTQRYRKAAPSSEHGGFYWGDHIDQVLRQPGCVGIRYYHGLGEDGSYQIVLVGVDGEGNDIVKVEGSGSGRVTRAVAKLAARVQQDAVILDTHFPCPPLCPQNSPLN